LRRIADRQAALRQVHALMLWATAAFIYIGLNFGLLYRLGIFNIYKQ